MIISWIISLWKKTKKLLQKEEYFLFYLTLIFYFFLFFNLNNKTLVLFFFLYLFSLWRFLKDFNKSLLLTYLAALPFKVGKTYEIELVSAQQLNQPWRPYGITNFIVISVKEIFISLMLLTLIRNFLIRKKKLIFFDFFSFFLLLIPISFIIASLFGSIRPEISLMHSIYFFSPLIFYLFLKNLLKKSKNILFSSLMVFSSMIIFQAILATLQFINQNILGLSIEISNEFLPIHAGVEEEVVLFRPLTTFNHANELAQFLLPYIFIFLPSLFFEIKKINRVFIFSFIASLWTFVLTLSRGAWLSFFICFWIFFFVLEKKWCIKLKLKREFLKIIIPIAPFALTAFIIFLLPRFINSFYAFETYGGAYTRVELIKDWVEIFKQFPLFGVGLGMDVFYAYQLWVSKGSPPTVFSYFSEAAHNGYLQLLTQVGIIAFLIFFYTCFLFIKKLINAIKNKKLIQVKIIPFSMLLGLISIFINNFFQPFIPNLLEIAFFAIIFSNSKELRRLI